ncbi:MAG: glutamate 5-kinase [Lachnospiraceae bacterium]|nr:glutamate 5-kinase [Lachnospiraceae bacterium]
MNSISEKKRIVIKIGSHSLVHPRTGQVDYIKMERLAMEISDIKNRGMDVCLVSSGAMAVGRQILGEKSKPEAMPKKQMHAAVGQARLMAIYQKFFTEYNQICGQVLMTKNTMIDNVSRKNAQNAFEELFASGVVPIVNNNDTVSTYEIRFGDNDTLSAIVTSLVKADLLIILTDIDGLYSADPREDERAHLVRYVDRVEEVMHMASDKPGSDVGTGGMLTKLRAARIATASGADMIICNGADVSILHRIFEKNYIGTLFAGHYDEDFDLLGVIEDGI